MRTSDGLSQLYLELADGYKKILMPQNGHITELRGSPIRKKTSKNFKTLSELKDQVHSQKELPNKYSSG